METKFNSQICTTREQSERLLALGLKKETADMVYHYTKSRCKSLEWELQPHSPTLRTNTHLNIEKLNVFGHKNSDGKVMTGEEYFDELWGKDIPAWSLPRLIEIMPESIVDEDWLGISFNDVSYYHGDGNGIIGWKFYKSGNLYDCIVDAYEWLIKEGYFNKEYLV